MNQEIAKHFSDYGALYSVLGGLIVIALLCLVLAVLFRVLGQLWQQSACSEAYEFERRESAAQQLELECQRDAVWQKEREQEAAEMAKVRAARALMSEANDLFERIKHHTA